jgi:hypothetical protein
MGISPPPRPHISRPSPRFARPHRGQKPRSNIPRLLLNVCGDRPFRSARPIQSCIDNQRAGVRFQKRRRSLWSLSEANGEKLIGAIASSIRVDLNSRLSACFHPCERFSNRVTALSSEDGSLGNGADLRTYRPESSNLRRGRLCVVVGKVAHAFVYPGGSRIREALCQTRSQARCPEVARNGT